MSKISRRLSPLHNTQSGEQQVRTEGFPLSLLRLPEDLHKSSEVTAFGVNMAHAPVPDRRYAADVCSIEFSEEGARIVFAQEGLKVGQIDSALIIKLNPHAVAHLDESLKDIKNPSVKEIAEMVGAKLIPLSQQIADPVQIAKMIANIAAVAVSGFETCIDFYHASAFAMRKVVGGHSLDVEPVVRVDLSTGLFLSLIDAIDQGVKRHNFRSA